MKSNMGNRVDHLKNFAKAWNTLDTIHIEYLLSDEVVYYSQWAEEEINGKNSFLSYLDEKFQNIKTAMCNELIALSAELAFHPGINNRPCILLKQVTADGITLVLLLLALTDGKIKRIDACYVPKVNELIMTGECPK